MTTDQLINEWLAEIVECTDDKSIKRVVQKIYDYGYNYGYADSCEDTKNELGE